MKDRAGRSNSPWKLRSLTPQKSFGVTTGVSFVLIRSSRDVLGKCNPRSSHGICRESGNARTFSGGEKCHKSE